MAAKKKESFNINSLFDDFINESYSAIETSSELNVIEFAEEILFNGKMQLFPTQIALLKAFYGLPLTENEKFILNGWKNEDRTTWTEDRKYTNLVWESGRSSGKSTIISIVTLYELYKWITDKDPCARYGLLPNSPVAIFVIGTSEKQITETLFKQIAGNARGSEFFSNLAERKEIEILTSEIRCTKKNIGLYAKHTNSPALRGYTIKCLVLDEAAFFENDEMGVSKANEVYSAVGKGVGRFGKEGYKIAISSAKEENDFIQQLYNVSRKHPQTLGFRLRTWDINLHKEQREEVLKANEDYVRDPLAAGLEYEGIRYNRQGAYFIQENVKKSEYGLSSIDAVSEALDFENDQGDTRHYVSVNITRLEQAHPSIQSFLHCDYGIKKDSAAVATCRPITLEDGRLGIIVDGYLLWKPYVSTNSNNEAVHRIVSFMDVETKLLQVSKTRRVKTASFDSFQSQSSIQKLHAHGIHTIEMSTSNANQLLYYGVTKKLIDQGLLVLPRDSTWSPKAMQDLLGIIQLPNGKITHDATEKDIPDAIANAVFNCYQYLIQSGKLNSLSSTLKTIQSPTQASTILLQGVPKKAMLDNQKSKIALLRSKNIR